jgi:hypothetical protein
VVSSTLIYGLICCIVTADWSNLFTDHDSAGENGRRVVRSG